MPEPISTGEPQRDRVYSPLNHEIPHNDPKYGFFELAPNTPDTASKCTDKPVVVVLAGKMKDPEKRFVLEIGKPEDLGMTSATNDVVIVNRQQFAQSQGTGGFKGLRDGEVVPLGRETPGRFNYPESVSRRHAQVERRGDQIIITDQGSTNGTALRIDREPSTPK